MNAFLKGFTFYFNLGDIGALVGFAFITLLFLATLFGSVLAISLIWDKLKK